MKSDSCQHEINLWNTKEIRNGRRNKYIYPVYYVKINDELLIAKQPRNRIIIMKKMKIIKIIWIQWKL